MVPSEKKMMAPVLSASVNFWNWVADKNEANKCQKTGRVGEDTVEEQGVGPITQCTSFVKQTDPNCERIAWE